MIAARRGSFAIGTLIVSRAAWTRIPRDFATIRADQFDAGGLYRRHESEGQGRDESAGCQEHQHTPICRRNADVHERREVWRHRGGRCVNGTVQHHPGHSESARRRPERKDEALGQQLSDDSPARRAERQPDPDLALTRDTTREQQVGHVRAADHQDQAERDENRREERETLQPVGHGPLPRLQLDGLGASTSRLHFEGAQGR